MTSLRAILRARLPAMQQDRAAPTTTKKLNTTTTTRSFSDDSQATRSSSESSKTTRSDRSSGGTILRNHSPRTDALEQTCSPRLRSSIIRAADRAAHLVLEEALATESARPTRLARLIEGPAKMILFEFVRSCASQQSGAPKAARQWHQLAQPASAQDKATMTKTSPPMPRVFGRMQLHASLQEFLSAVRRDDLADSDHRVDELVNPGAEDTALCFVAADNYSEYTAIKRFKRRLPSSVQPRQHQERRDFVVMTHQREFTADDGRRGWLVVHHSAKWPVGGDHQDKSLPAPATTSSTPEGSERPGGSIYHSGLVVLESFDDPMELDVFAVGEFRLRGSATGRDNHNAARAFVRELLENVSTEVERRAAARLSLLQSRVFHAVRADSGSEHARCVACRDKIGHCPPNTAPYVCRKCCENVCGCCSSVNRLGTKELRLCMECWADATLNRDLA